MQQLRISYSQDFYINFEKKLHYFSQNRRKKSRLRRMQTKIRNMTAVYPHFGEEFYAEHGDSSQIRRKFGIFKNLKLGIHNSAITFLPIPRGHRQFGDVLGPILKLT